MKTTFEVIVGNVGTVYSGPNKREAVLRYNTYVDRSKTGRGRCGDEDVTLMQDGEIVMEHDGPSVMDAEDK